MVESLVLRLRRLRAALIAALKRLIGTQRSRVHAKVDEITEATSAAWEAERAWRERQGQRMGTARSALLINSLLIATLIASAIYAPVSGYDYICWGIASACAVLLNKRGVNWQHAWRDASLKLTGWW